MWVHSACNRGVLAMNSLTSAIMSFRNPGMVLIRRRTYCAVMPGRVQVTAAGTPTGLDKQAGDQPACCAQLCRPSPRPLQALTATSRTHWKQFTDYRGHTVYCGAKGALKIFRRTRPLLQQLCVMQGHFVRPWASDQP